MSGSQQAQMISRISAAEEKRLGLPENFKFYSAFPFQGMNQQAARTAMSDQEFFLLENMLITGPAQMRTLWDRGASLYSAPAGKTIVYFSWFNVGASQNCAVFLSDGTAVQVSSAGAVTTISSVPGTFYNGGQLPIAQQSGSQFLLIGNNLTSNSYWIWDGAVLYASGTLGPYQLGGIVNGGSGYTSSPSISAFGGSGSGAAFTASIANGSIVSISVINPGTGYLPGEVVQLAFTGGGSDAGAVLQAVLSGGAVDHLNLISGGSGYTSAPAVAITGGGGSGATAVATISGGAVNGLTILTHGTGYTSSPSVGFSGGAGSGASAVAVLSGGSVGSVTVVAAGSGYTGTPALSFQGGGGSGAAGVAVMAGGTIASVTMSTGGTGYTSLPTVEVQPGLNNSATATLGVMPFGVSGTAIETFLNRVWISNPAQVGPTPSGNSFLVSGPGSLTNFATSAGGLLFNSSDRFLRVNYVALRQSNGYLYTFGDSSVSVINNVQTSGASATTSFNYQNANSQIGIAFRDSAQDYKQGILFANPNGVHGVYGGSVRTVSGKIVNLVNDAVFPPVVGAVSPSSAVATIHTIPVYLLLMTIKDPQTALYRTVMVGYDEKEWFVASQSSTLTYIGSQEVNSILNAWGTNGASLFPLFTTPSASLAKRVVSKAYGGEREFIVKEPLVLYLRVTDKSVAQTGVSMTAKMDSEGIATQIGSSPQLLPQSFPLVVAPNFLAPDGTQPVWAAAASSVHGTAIGTTITSTSADFVISGISIGYRDVASLFG